MMPDIFSTFDPASSNFFIRWITLFLLINMIMFPILLNKTHAHINRWASLGALPLDIMFSQLSRTGAKSLKGLSSIIAPIFMTLIAINLMGMLPYTFSLSSHLIMTLTIGFPLWLSMIISSFTHAPKQSTAHFLPDGAPDWLNPFLVLIESTSVIVRPLTLSFRLAANMTAGHIVLSLVGTYGSAAIMTSITSSAFLLMTSSGYILFEFAICLIQAYIFCLLLSLYSDDHAH